MVGCIRKVHGRTDVKVGYMVGRIRKVRVRTDVKLG